jgi:uncharacterized protein YcsI (UPF0317 family)
MTNTRLTAPEVIERRYPVVVREFSVRRGSGGSGVWRGGDGVRREIEFREALTAAILSERRVRAPFGLHGAGAGARGRNLLLRGGRQVELPGKVRVSVATGDVLVVETPGGGGYDPSPREWAAMSPAEARGIFRQGRWRGTTAHICAGRLQANLVVVPAAAADAFEAYCRANARPCPLLERLGAGEYLTRELAAGADLRTDLPLYRKWALGEQEQSPSSASENAGGPCFLEAPDATPWWRQDMTAFLLGCSFSFEEALTRAGIVPRHVEQAMNVPMYRTSIDTAPAGPFGGKLVVSMRPVPAGRVRDAFEVTRGFPASHGEPVHAGEPSAIGIADLSRPDWGDAVEIRTGEVPLFWACGVTSQVAMEGALRSGAIDLAITHAPGHMFISDWPAQSEKNPGPP